MAFENVYGFNLDISKDRVFYQAHSAFLNQCFDSKMIPTVFQH